MMTLRPKPLLFSCTLALGFVFPRVGASAEDTVAPANDADGQADATLDALVAKLRSLGLMITADEKKIAAATGEAPYFMYADRREHRPKREPLRLPKDANWLEGKPVFAEGAKKQAIYPLFDKLVQRMGYNEVALYAADVHYGVSSHARFKLYELGYRKDDPRKGKRRRVLLGDADYVINLP
jgi:hypothetical protein